MLNTIRMKENKMSSKKSKRISFRAEEYIFDNLNSIADAVGVSSAELNRMIMDEFLRNEDFQEQVLSRMRFPGAVSSHLEIDNERK